jgi:hypothetical protein
MGAFLTEAESRHLLALANRGRERRIVINGNLGNSETGAPRRRPSRHG